MFHPTGKDAIIIPIPNPGKDHTDPNNFHPIVMEEKALWITSEDWKYLFEMVFYQKTNSML